MFSAWEPGTYYGQCAEFCGLQHAMMKFRIVALDPRRLAGVGRRRSKQPAPTPTDRARAAQGMDLFFGTNGEGGQCIACHAIGGTPAGKPGGAEPDDFAIPTHQCFAGCDFETFIDGKPNVEALEAWLRDPNAVKLGTKMPDYNLTDRRDRCARRLPVHPVVGAGARPMASVTDAGRRRGSSVARWRRPGFWSWFTTVDHKKIGILYGISSFVFFIIGGLRGVADPLAAGEARATRCSTPTSTTRSSRCTA